MDDIRASKPQEYEESSEEEFSSDDSFDGGRMDYNEIVAPKVVIP